MEPQTQALSVFSRHYYIDKKYQSKMIIKFCLLAFTGTIFFCALFYSSLNRELGGGYAQALEGMRFIKSGMLMNFVLTDGLSVLFLGVCVVILTLLMSHRIAGPLWRLEHSALAIGSGDLTLEIRLREKDEIKTLANKMNRMTSALRKRVVDIHKDYCLLEVDIVQLKESIEKGKLTSGEIQALAGEVRESSLSLLARLDKMKTR